jgi:hypothetical protein
MLMKEALGDVETVRDADQGEPTQALHMALRKRIDAKLARAEARGGSTPHEDVAARLKARILGD